MDIKKGDLMQKRQEVMKGKSLLHGYSSLEKAEEAMKSVRDHYNLPEGVKVKVGYDDLNSGEFAVFADEDTFVIIEARVNWVVDREVGLTYTDSGGSAILDMGEEEGWIVVESAKPQLQSGVEHMTDDELRESLEALRYQRVSRPASAKPKKRVGRPGEPKMSAEDKALTKVLEGMTEDKKIELMKKLGMVE
jgi:hypothetical protein